MALHTRPQSLQIYKNSKNLRIRKLLLQFPPQSLQIKTTEHCLCLVNQKGGIKNHSLCTKQGEALNYSSLKCITILSQA